MSLLKSEPSKSVLLKSGKIQVGAKLKSLAPTLIKLSYLWFSNDPESID